MTVPTRIDVDGAKAAAYLPVAKRFLARLRAAMPHGGARYYEFGSVKMHLWWTGVINKIRITAAGGTGRYYTSFLQGESGFVLVNPRYYLLDNGELEQYAESPEVSNPVTGSFSLDGKTLVYAATNNIVGIRRQRRAPQTIANSVMVRPTLINRPPIDWVDNASVNTLTQSPGVSEDGKHVFVMNNGVPQVYRLSAAQEAQEALPEDQWTGDTSFDLVSSGFPAAVTGYYTGLNTMVGTATPSEVGPLSYGLEIRNDGNLLSQGVVRAAYDSFSDRPVLLFTLPLSTGTDGSGAHVMSVRWWLFAYDYTTESWQSIWIRDVPNAWRHAGGFTLGGGLLANSHLVENFSLGAFGSFPEIVSGENGLGVLYLVHDIDITVHPTVSAASTYSTGGGNSAAFFSGTLVASDLPPAFEHLREDVNMELAQAKHSVLALRNVFGFPANQLRPSAYSAGGFITRYYQNTANFGGLPPVTPDAPFPASAGEYWALTGGSTVYLGQVDDTYRLSPNGRRLFYTVSGFNIQYHENGVLLVNGTGVFGGRWSYERPVLRTGFTEVHYDGGIVNKPFAGSTDTTAIPSRGPLEENVAGVSSSFELSQAELLTNEFIPQKASSFP